MNDCLIVRFFFCIVGISCILTGCSSSDRYVASHLSGVIWGTTYNITYNEENFSEDNALSLVQRALGSVDSAANAFNPSSEISKLNIFGTLENPSQTLLDLLQCSRHIYNITSGAFDPTVGPLVNMWGFGSGVATSDPDDKMIDSVRNIVGFDNLFYDDKKVELCKDGMSVDLAAIAKGAGVDKVADSFSSAGIKDFLIEIGGEVRVHGKNPHGQAWAIQIDAPIQDNTATHHRLAILELRDAAIATSGNYRNFSYDNLGNLLYHTISPQTGRPIQTDVLSATIIAKNTMVADALATACMVLGLERATALIESLAKNDDPYVYGAILITHDSTKDSQFSIHSIALNSKHASVSQ